MGFLKRPPLTKRARRFRVAVIAALRTAPKQTDTGLSGFIGNITFADNNTGFRAFIVWPLAANPQSPCISRALSVSTSAKGRLIGQ
jgi:hypothetical protein